MMGYIFIPLWAALQICFAALFLSSFLETKRRKEELAWIAVAAWLLTAVYGLFEVQGIHGYLMYLLAAVLLLLTVHGEYGPKGLCLLGLAFLIPVISDLAAANLAANISGLPHYLAVTAGKVLPLLLVLILRLFSAAKPESRKETESMLLRQHMEMQQESMRVLEQNFRIQRKSTHEFEHHMQVLRDLLARDQVDAAREYLDRLKKNRSIRLTHVSSNHPVIDVILNQKYQTALENGIKMQIRVNDLSSVEIPSDALVVVLTNLLDNAIEGCRRIDGHREILCSILYDDGLYISIRNTSLPVEIIDGKIPTSKQGSLHHGFGLLSVTYALDNLDGEYTFGYDEGWFHFAAEVV